MQPVTRIIANKSITTDQSGGVTPVVDQIYGVLTQTEADLQLREPATVLSDNYTLAENVSVPFAWGSPLGDDSYLCIHVGAFASNPKLVKLKAEATVRSMQKRTHAFSLAC